MSARERETGRTRAQYSIATWRSPSFFSGALTGVPKSTMANKSKRIRDLLRLGPFDHEFCRRELLEQSPVAWLVVVNGIVVDARWLPPELQAEACRRGLIPDLEPTTTAGISQPETATTTAAATTPMSTGMRSADR